MPVQVSYPGVYVEEIPSGARTITGVATSVAALIGTFRKGPQDAAMRVFSMADFERIYGGLVRTSAASYAVQQFFLNGGTEAWIVRVVNDGVPAVIDAAVTAELQLNTDPDGVTGTDVFIARAGRRVLGESVDDPGVWGNDIRVEVDYDTGAPATLFNLKVSEVRIDGDRTIVLQTEVFRNLTTETDTPNNALEVVNQGSRLVQLDLAGATPAVADRPATSGTFGADLAATIPILASIDTLNVTLNLAGNTVAVGPVTLGPILTVPANFTVWAQDLQRFIRAAANDAAFTGDADFEPHHRDYLQGATVQVIGDGTAGNPRHFLIRTGATSRPFDPTATLTFGAADAASYGLDGGATIGPQFYELGGGVDGTVFDALSGAFAMPATAYQGTRAAKTGLYGLEDVDLFNILAIPEAALMDDVNMRAVYAEAEAYAEERRSMLIVDIAPDIVRLGHMETWLAENESLRHPNAAVYFPRTNVPDRLNQNRPRSVAASGTIAGLWARTDTQRGVWKAPAGTDARLRNVESLTYLMTDQENGALNPLGINCLRTFPVYANICWGARTLEGADVIASDWKYVPVRRTTLFIEESLFRGTKWAVFEPNDEPLWSQIRLNVGAFMQDLFRKGAFQGSTPRDAYFVKCDSETTTQQDIDNGIVNIEVGFAPLKPAEFVILKIQQIARTAEA